MFFTGFVPAEIMFFTRFGGGGCPGEQLYVLPLVSTRASAHHSTWRALVLAMVSTSGYGQG